LRFRDRVDAGRQLAERLFDDQDPNPLVLALPRGGVPVAREIAERLNAPLDVLLVRKLGVPGHPELAMGAIAAGGVKVLSADLIAELGIPPHLIEQVASAERAELDRRAAVFRHGRPPIEVQGRTVIVVDDGFATGSTMEAAVQALRQMSPRQVVVAVPVGARETCERIARIADRVICLYTPPYFQAVGEWYDDFSQTTDDDVVRQLESAAPVQDGEGRPGGAGEARR